MSSTSGGSGRHRASCPEMSGNRCGMTGTLKARARLAIRRNGVMPPTRHTFGWMTSQPCDTSKWRNSASANRLSPAAIGMSMADRSQA